MSASTNALLAEPWKQLWNNDLSLTDKIIASDFVAHAEASQVSATTPSVPTNSATPAI